MGHKERGQDPKVAGCNFFLGVHLKGGRLEQEGGGALDTSESDEVPAAMTIGGASGIGTSGLSSQYWGLERVLLLHLEAETQLGSKTVLEDMGTGCRSLSVLSNCLCGASDRVGTRR